MKIPSVFESRLKPGIVSPGKPFVVCGAGIPEMGMVKSVESAGGGKPVVCLLEKDMESIWGIPVISIDDLLKMEKDTLVLISVLYAPFELYRILSEHGFTNIYSVGDLHLVNPYLAERQDSSFAKKMVAENGDNIRKARNLLADEKSKEIFDTRLEVSQTGEWEKLERLWEDEQYFVKDIIHLDKGNEVFVDCGFYDFRNSMEFIFKTGGEYGHIYAFDMYAPFLRSAELVIQSYGIKNVTLFNTALGDKKRKAMQDLSFAGSCPVISLDGDVLCQMDSLDNILFDLPLRPTFIKTDVEGMDLQAVKGAKKMIQRDKPKLAISAYHLLEHLWMIPLLIHELEPSYKLYMRHHLRSMYETVCYAVAPK